jgi:flagellar hook protein FlgE
MLRSMFTAISSLNLHQGYLDVVANNLANANTVGYKAARVLFQDQFSQLINPGAAPTATIGGINPTQIGLGVQNGYISPVFTQGALESTGRNLDLAIQGDGFFVYDQGAARRYSREGSMALDSNGYIVNAATGLRLQGWMANAAGVVDTNLPAGSIQIPSNRTTARATTTAQLGGNLNADLTAAPVNTVVPVTMGAYDSLGNMIPVTVDFTRTGANTWTWASNGSSGTLTFSASGQLPANTTGTVNIPLTTGATTPLAVTMNFSNMTMLAAPNSATVTTQDGLPTGTVSDVYITPNDGSIYLVYSNGMREQVGQVAVARFTNPAGLIRSGHTMFQVGLDSGDPQLGAANTGGRGPIASGSLESSNVDMAQEFTNMILAQRGFQASSRVITTSDEIIQELVNLKR